MGKKDLTRREFAIGATAATAALATGLAKIGHAKPEGRPDIVSVHGPHIASNVRKSLEPFGGIGAFVKKGQTVGLLSNTIGRSPGAFTSPIIVATIAELCKRAGATDVCWFDWRNQKRLRQNKLIELTKNKHLRYEFVSMDEADKWRTVQVPRGKVLKKVRIFNVLYEPDVFISLPMMKHHSGANFTGALKLYMGATHQKDNREYFHQSGQLEQCIADLCTVIRKPDLIVMDATQVITTGGPMGLGEMAKPEKVITGVDAVAVDTYAAPIQSIDPKTSIQIKAAAEHKVGETDLTRLKVKEIENA